MTAFGTAQNLAPGYDYGMNWLEERLRQIGKNKSGAAKAIKKPATRITEIAKGKRRILENEWAPLAHYLEWTTEELHQAVEGRMSASQKIFTAPLQPATVSLPIFGATITGGGVLMLDRVQIGRADRPPMLQYSAAAFGFYCTTDLHSPAFEPKDLVLVDPARPVAVGDDVVVVRGYDAPGAFDGVLCRLVAQTDRHWEVVQWKGGQNPKRLAKDEWPRALFVAGKYSR